MRIRLYWADCTLGRQENEPIDSFWLEATESEAIKEIYPYCPPNAIAQSQLYGKRDLKIASQFSNPPRPFCFLIASDLSTIKPFTVYYPYSPMWEAHSPFKPIAPHKITHLSELKNLDLNFYSIKKDSGCLDTVLESAGWERKY